MPTEVLWQAVLGVTYQYTSGHIAEALYTDYCQFLKVRHLCGIVFGAIVGNRTTRCCLLSCGAKHGAFLFNSTCRVSSTMTCADSVR
jgi:hypothetical protein